MKAKLRDDRAEAVGPNDVWAMDFVHDQQALGKKLRILTIADTHSRYCPATDVRFQYRGEDVVQTLEQICRKPERALVHEPCGCGRKAGGLAQTLQRRSTPQRHRIQRPERAALTRRLHQPAAMNKAGNSGSRWSKIGRQGK